MNYTFEINIQTDGDFILSFIPHGMQYDEEDYYLSKDYKDRETAINDIINICKFLKDQIRTHKDYIKSDWDYLIDSFIKSLQESNEDVDECIEEGIYGNYDIEFMFYAVKQYFNCGFYVNDEELEILKNDKVTEEMVKSTILNLYTSEDKQNTNNTINEIIQVIEDWKKNSDVVSCETVIKLLNSKLLEDTYGNNFEY